MTASHPMRDAVAPHRAPAAADRGATVAAGINPAASRAEARSVNTAWAGRTQQTPPSCGNRQSCPAAVATGTAGASAPAVAFSEFLHVTFRVRCEVLMPRRCPRCDGEHFRQRGRYCPACLRRVSRLRAGAEKSNAVQARAKYRRERGWA